MLCRRALSFQLSEALVLKACHPVHAFRYTAKCFHLVDRDLPFSGDGATTLHASLHEASSELPCQGCFAAICAFSGPRKSAARAKRVLLVFLQLFHSGPADIVMLSLSVFLLNWPRDQLTSWYPLRPRMAFVSQWGRSIQLHLGLNRPLGGLSLQTWPWLHGGSVRLFSCRMSVRRKCTTAQ